ncbi:MAG: nitrogen regulation protein NR(I), partial [Methylococcales bacterium]|nr:nitrogen regulation protein NR(I) [Methylococcales bacterium]
PPLRDRKQDVPILMRHFLSLAATELSSEIKILNPETEDYLSSLPWPGNVRQLENTCRWLTVMAAGREIHMEDLPPELTNSEKGSTDKNIESWETLLESTIRQKLLIGQSDVAKTIIPEVESILIKSALKYTSGKKNEAALLLGYGRNTLTRKIKELSIE